MKQKKYILNVKVKNIGKVIRTIFEVIIIFAVVTVFAFMIVNTKHYEAPDKSAWANRDGFVALTYFGVNRAGSSKLIPQQELNKQLKVLYDMGYRTISQQDILDFYNGKPLPENALFLGFEDGRNDSSLFAQKIMEKYNYRATMFTYGNRLNDEDSKFLNAEQLVELTETGYWELGSNGYRLTYINVLDRLNNYIPIIDYSDYNEIETAKDYTHYLMDFLRDKDGIPTEDRNEMQERIYAEYSNMETAYTQKIGYMPGAYIIMHSNELYNGMNDLVEAANDQDIRSFYKMNFNRNLNSYNTQDENLYDLNRLQVGAYWYTNHLLMAIQRDIGRDVSFLTGETDRASDWEVKKGAAEFLGNTIAFTSPPKSDGLMLLKSGQNYDNITISTTFTGEVVGNQCIYLRYAEDGNSYLRMRSSNNQIIVEQKTAGQSVETLFAYNMALPGYEKENGPSRLQEEFLYNDDGSINEDAPQPYLKGLNKTTDLKAELTGQSLRLTVDGYIVNSNISIDPSIIGGGIALGTWRSRINAKDDIYDAVFQDLKITKAGEQDAFLYSNTYDLWDGILAWIKDAYDALLNWSMAMF